MIKNLIRIGAPSSMVCLYWQGSKMHSKFEDFKNGWIEVDISLKPEDIENLIELLNMIKQNPEQHFHISSDYQGAGGVGSITFTIQEKNETDNMVIFGKAIMPGEKI